MLSVPSQIYQLAESFLLPMGGGTEGVGVETSHIFPSGEWSGNYRISMEIVLWKIENIPHSNYGIVQLLWNIVQL